MHFEISELQKVCKKTLMSFFVHQIWKVVKNCVILQGQVELPGNYICAESLSGKQKCEIDN